VSAATSAADRRMTEIEYPRFRWIALLAMGVAAGATIANVVAPATLIPEIARRTGISMGAAALGTMGTLDLSTGSSALIGGFLADRFGFGRVWLVCFAMMIAGALLMPLCGDSFGGLAALRLLQGFGAGPVVATLPMGAMRWFPARDRGIVIGVQGTMVSLSAAGTMLFVPAMFQRSGDWSHALAWVALFSLAGLLAALVMAFGPQPPADPHAPDARGRHGAPPSRGEMGRVLRLPATLAAIACGFLFTWQQRAFNDMVPAFLASDPPAGLGHGPLGAGVMMSAVQVAFMIGPLLGGVLTDRVFRGSARVLIAGCFALSGAAAAALLLPAVQHDGRLLAATLLACGFAMSITSPQVMTFIVKRHPPQIIGKLGGILMACNIVGGLVGVALCAYALHVSNAYTWTLALIAAAPLLGVFAALFLVGPAPPAARAARAAPQAAPQPTPR